MDPILSNIADTDISIFNNVLHIVASVDTDYDNFFYTSTGEFEKNHQKILNNEGLSGSKWITIGKKTTFIN